MAAKSRPTGMMCLDASSTKLNANLVFSCPFPSSILCRLATIPAVANRTRQELRAHLRVGLQPGVLPKVFCASSWSKSAKPVGAVAR